MLTPERDMKDSSDVLLAWLLAAQQAAAMPSPALRKATPAPAPLWIVDARVGALLRLYDIGACLSWLAGANGQVTGGNFAGAGTAHTGLPMVLLHNGVRSPEQWDALVRAVPRLLVLASADYVPAFGFVVLRLRSDADTAKVDQMLTGPAA